MSNLKTVYNQVNKAKELQKERDISLFNQTCQDLFDEMSDSDLEVLATVTNYEDYPSEFLAKYEDRIVNIGLLNLTLNNKYGEDILINSSTIDKKGRIINGY